MQIRKSPRALGGWIATVQLPVSLGDTCFGWHSRRCDSPEQCAYWLAGVIKNHLVKRAKYHQHKRDVRAAKEGAPA